MTAPTMPSDGWPRDLALRDDGESQYWIEYRVVLVTRRRRPVFEDAALRSRVETRLRSAATEMECRVGWCDVTYATVETHVEAPPTLSPRDLALGLRQRLEDELALEAGGDVFARRYVVTTGPLCPHESGLH